GAGSARSLRRLAARQDLQRELPRPFVVARLERSRILWRGACQEVLSSSAYDAAGLVEAHIDRLVLLGSVAGRLSRDDVDVRGSELPAVGAHADGDYAQRHVTFEDETLRNLAARIAAALARHGAQERHLPDVTRLGRRRWRGIEVF